MTDPEVRWLLIESLTFDLKFKMILGPLKVRSAPIDECILHTKDVETLTIVLRLE